MLSGGGFPRVFAGAGDRGIPKNLVLVLGVQRPESKHLVFSQGRPRAKAKQKVLRLRYPALNCAREPSYAQDASL
jgi:hypothetical protein